MLHTCANHMKCAAAELVRWLVARTDTRASLAYTASQLTGHASALAFCVRKWPNGAAPAAGWLRWEGRLFLNCKREDARRRQGRRRTSGDEPPIKNGWL